MFNKTKKNECKMLKTAGQTRII